ncbi:protein/domain associated with flavoprotein oxygenase, DIM6/NTAB family [Teratosphaeria destructans]|uniref:Protein/domain associated with flavoprotein oxygenase, DIM6/NTAB family n=1 Tax=Teratosphaeria destructans TaxID=418781 RepID=A0A9W7SKC6_9PEZI|nr:protein/domain associated with flavoprotein oxygenase, DIM6/NTAB family [Teratosphaeria destructans]
MATYALREAVNATAEWFARDVDEFARRGPGEGGGAHGAVQHARCGCPGTPPMGTADVVIGRVVAVHIAESVLTDGLVDLGKVQPIARCGYHQYARITGESLFEMVIPGDPKQLVGLEGSAKGNQELGGEEEREARAQGSQG